MNLSLFGTDGIRSRAGSFPLNAVSIVAIGQAIGERLGGTLLIGFDTRISSPWILGLLKQGIQRTSTVVHDAGVIPTPGIALLVKTDGYSGGIMISASHNPFEDNGVKVFSNDGTKLSDTAETEIERQVFALLGDGLSAVRRQRDEIPNVSIARKTTRVFPTVMRTGSRRTSNPENGCKVCASSSIAPMER
jgi:phosphomannomutase